MKCDVLKYYGNCEVWFLKCEVRTKTNEVWTVKWDVWSMSYEAWATKCETLKSLKNEQRTLTYRSLMNSEK